MAQADTGTIDHFETPITLDRDMFMRRLIASLGHLNEGILGSNLTGAYIMNVGLSMGAAIEEEYKHFWGIERPFTLDEYAHVIVDLKQKIRGNFSLVSKDTEKVVVSTTSCPFDEFVRQSPSLCFMTSSVFGGIAARNFGYAKVILHKRIALGDPGCYVTVYLQRTPEAEAAVGKEYFPDLNQASPDIARQLHLMEQMRALRKQLSETTSRWEEVIHGAAEAITLFNAGGHIVYANARWRNLLGFEADELQGMSFERLVHPDERQQVETLLESTRQGTRVGQHILRLRHRDGTWRSVSISAGPVRDDEGRILGTLSILYDVTQERESQRLKDDLLTSTSHELRTPVTTIKGMTQVLLRGLEKQGALDPELLAQRLQTIQREADRLAHLASELVDVTQLQRGSIGTHRQQYDLNELVAARVKPQQDLKEMMQRHTLTLQLALHPVLVRVEGKRIQQIIDNLLDNALKYSPEGGKITVTIQVEGQQAHVRISDQGIGIPEGDLPRLFTPFFRGSNASSRNFSGLGLGLYLSRGLAEVNGGTLSVESVEGQGATFILSLPLSQML